MRRDKSGYQRIGPSAHLPPTLAGLGADPKEVLLRCGFAPDALDNPDGVIPFYKAGELLEACVKASDCPHFGLLIGQKATSSSFGLIGALMRNAPTWGDAIRDVVANHHRFVRGGVLYLFPIKDEMLLGYAVYQGGDVSGVAQICDVV